MSPTKEKLIEMKLSGMVEALEDQENRRDDYLHCSFEDRLSLLVDAEYSRQQNDSFAQRLKKANLRQTACLEDVDLQKPRGLDRQLMQQLATCSWASKGIGIMLTGPTGIGKSFLACALAHKACRAGYTVQYSRASRLFQDLLLARMKGRYTQVLKQIAKLHVLVIDDFALAPINDEQGRDLLEVVDDRVGIRSLVIASQIPLENWHSVFANATIADAILDRVVNSSYKISMEGKTRRKPAVDD